MTQSIELLSTLDPEARRRALERALELLGSGRLVGVPTESLYGVLVPEGAAPDPDAMNEFRARGFQPVELTRADPREVLAAIDHPTPAARRLIERYLPGPLQLRVETRGRQVLARVPGDDTTRELLRRSKVPLTLYEIGSTNVSWAAAVAPESFAGALPAIGLAAVVSCGVARIGQPPAAVAASLSEFTILRTGLLSAADLERTALRRILFVCSGNTCRSPMAAALLKLALEKRLEIPAARLAAAGFVIESAGAFAVNGSPPSAGASHAMGLREIDLATHRSRLLDPALFAKQDLVFAMTRSILGHLKRAFAAAPGVEHIDPEQHDVLDPFGGDAQEYEQCAIEIAARIDVIADQLAYEPDARSSG